MTHFEDIVGGCSSVLPFCNEPLDEIDENTDVVAFVNDFTIYWGSDDGSDFRSYVHKSRLIEYASTEQNVGQPRLDTEIIGALKYTFAFSRMLQCLCSMDYIAILSLPYLDETDREFASSIMLLKEGFVKQSLQHLRNALEATVAHTFFASQGDDFYSLATASSPRMPRFAGRPTAMVPCLAARGLLTIGQARWAEKVYGGLSEAVHSGIRLLVNTDKWSGITDSMSYDWIGLWCDQVTNVGLLTLVITLRMVAAEGQDSRLFVPRVQLPDDWQILISEFCGLRNRWSRRAIS